MITVLIPVGVMLAVILCKKIPKIGGNVQVALVLAGILSLALGGVYQPTAWCGALIDGMDRLAWVICLSVFGSIYAETQVRLGTCLLYTSEICGRNRGKIPDGNYL